jgi:iron-sulfur cluster assembly protein
MINLSEPASDKIKQMAKNKNCPSDIRIMVVGGGCSGLTYDMNFEPESSEDDESYESHGVTLLVDPMSLSYLDDTHIDYIETFAFSGFHFDNPNAKKSCGCGSSFTV